MLAKLFGARGKDGKIKVPTPDEALVRLREVEEMLIKKQEFLEGKIERELETAKKNGTKNKRVALAALKRKKRLEKALQQIDGTLTTIEYQKETLENASTNTEVLKVMGDAARALKKTHNDLDVDKVHDLMDDIAEQQQLSDEISTAISQPVGFGQDVDEDALLQELEELEAEQVEKDLLHVGPDVGHLPSVPSTEPTVSTKPAAAAQKKRTKEDDELAELEAWAN